MTDSFLPTNAEYPLPEVLIAELIPTLTVPIGACSMKMLDNAGGTNTTLL